MASTVAGCYRIRLGWDTDYINCLTVKVGGTGKFDKSSAMLYKNLAVTMEPCTDPPDPNQCFQIEDDYTNGPFRIMQKDLCLVLPKSAKDAVQQQMTNNYQETFLWRAPVDVKMLPCTDIASGPSAQSHKWERVFHTSGYGDVYWLLVPQFSQFDNSYPSPLALAVDPDRPGGLAVVSTLCDQSFGPYGILCTPKDDLPYTCLDNTYGCCDCLFGVDNTHDGLFSPYSLLHSAILDIQVLEPGEGITSSMAIRTWYVGGCANALSVLHRILAHISYPD